MKLSESKRRVLATALIAAFALGSAADKAVSELREFILKRGAHPITDLEKRITPFREALARHKVIGYITDGQNEDLSFLAIQYAVVPSILVSGTGPSVVIGNFTESMSREEFRSRFGLILLEDLGGGIYLLMGEGG